jgi:cobalt-zinc-cadmium efflux system outer membrane protein
MNHVLRIFVFAATGFAIPALTYGQVASNQIASQFFDPTSGISVDEAVARALRDEPGLRAARTTIDAARGQHQQAALRPNPSVIASHQAEPGGTDAQTRVELQWPLDLYRKSGRVVVAQHEIETTELAVRDRERIMAADVRTAYGAVAGAARDVAILDDIVASVAQQHQLITARVNEGATPPLERDLLAVALNRLRAERLRLAADADAALIELKRVLGLPPDAPLRLRDTLESLVQRDATVPTAPGSTPIEDRPDVREAATKITLADARIDRAERDARIDASIFGMYMRMDAGFPQQGFDANGQLQRVRGQFHYLAGGVMMTLPLRDRRQGEIAAARAERAGAEASLDAARLSARAELEAARSRERYAVTALDVWSADVRTLARRNLDILTQTYELGRASLQDLLSERRRYLEFEQAYTAALRELYEARQAVRRATGAGQ